MQRHKIVNIIGEKYQNSNVENGEFSYPKEFKRLDKDITKYQRNNKGITHKYLDLRFTNDRLVVLVETKNRFDKWNKEDIENQLQDYVHYEKALSNKKIVAILAETEGNEVYTWHGQSVIIDDKYRDTDENSIQSFNHYYDLCFGKVNDKIKIVDSIRSLNEKLHADGINERIRSQFVGTCLLALKNGLQYENIQRTLNNDGKTLTPEQVIIKNIQTILSGLLTNTGSLNKAGKLSILNNKVLESQDVISLSYPELSNILSFINFRVLPYINDRNTAGQDLLNLFFTTFNKYVGKADKNQAFTPDHICDFMSKAVDVNKYSRILDPCCGSGSFLVRSMTEAMDDCDTESERDTVKADQIYGIEYDESAYGLSSTNMLIHGDGNSNVVCDSMFNRGKWINDSDINVVLMNPPYNATKKNCDPDYVKTWSTSKKEDPSRGLHFVYWVANHVSHNCKMCVLLPMQAAIGNSSEIKHFKKKMLDSFTLDAVFSLPDDIFYPGASAVACCMIFDLSQSHKRSDRDTFFGYFKNDNFTKRKGLGRVETTDASGKGQWSETEKQWLDLYKNKKEVPGLSVMKKVGYKDEWLAEAYMKTNYNDLSSGDFENVINDYLSYLVKEGDINES